MHTNGNEFRARCSNASKGGRALGIPAALFFVSLLCVLIPPPARAFDPNLLDGASFDGYDYDHKKVIVNYYSATGEKLLGWTETHRRGLEAFKRKEYAAVLQLFTPLADKGDPHSSAFLALMYREGLGVKWNAEKAYEYVMRACEKGIPVSQFLLGEMARTGYGTGSISADNDKAAFKLYMWAAKQGLAPAQAKAASMFYSGRGVKKDVAEAYRWGLKAADQGDAGAQTLIGDLFYFGEGVKRDPAQAYAWYSRAAGQTILARYMLGYMCESGEGTALNHALAADWYRKALEGEGVPYPPSAFNLGLLYENGLGVSQDFGEAARWYGEAANIGYDIASTWYGYDAEVSVAKAQVRLSLLYWGGKGVARDYARSAELAAKAAEWGDADAQWVIGVLYLNGDGVTRDVETAKGWFREAAAQGHGAAAAKLKSLEESGVVEP